MADSTSFIRATMSERASSRWLHTLVISSLAATFSASRRRTAALSLSTSCTDGPAPAVDTEIISWATLRGEEGAAASSAGSSRPAKEAGGMGKPSLEGSNGENGVGGG